MGIFSIFKRNKFDKITRTEVVDSIIKLEKQQTDIVASVDSNNTEVTELMIKGKAEKDVNMRMFYAKKIENLRRNSDMAARRLQFVATNMSAMYQLKSAMDDREFLNSASNLSLNEMLTKPKELSKFLNSVNSQKMSSEDSLANVLDTFETAESGYIENDSIYGQSDSQQSIMAMFDEESISDDMSLFGDMQTESKSVKVTIEAEKN